jgi:hypothetical protein
MESVPFLAFPMEFVMPHHRLVAAHQEYDQRITTGSSRVESATFILHRRKTVQIPEWVVRRHLFKVPGVIVLDTCLRTVCRIGGMANTAGIRLAVAGSDGNGSSPAGL